MQMMVEIIGVNVVAQEEMKTLAEMLSFKKQEKEKELAEKMAASSRCLVL